MVLLWGRRHGTLIVVNQQTETRSSFSRIPVLRPYGSEWDPNFWSKSRQKLVAKASLFSDPCFGTLLTGSWGLVARTIYISCNYSVRVLLDLLTTSHDPPGEIAEQTLNPIRQSPMRASRTKLLAPRAARRREDLLRAFSACACTYSFDCGSFFG